MGVLYQGGTVYFEIVYLELKYKQGNNRFGTEASINYPYLTIKYVIYCVTIYCTYSKPTKEIKRYTVHKFMHLFYQLTFVYFIYIRQLLAELQQ